MDLNFDIRGYLKPYERTSIQLEDLKSVFVDPFEEPSIRSELYQSYERYTKDFSKEITPNFRQWINGSFVTNKRSPKDIDLVNLIDYHVAEEKEKMIREKFIRDSTNKNYGIDAYLVILYPENHKLYNWTRSDLVYWHDWFTKSKMDRRKKRHPKGYVEINFGTLNSAQ